MLAGFTFHLFSERAHREAHQRSSEITGIVDQGMYGKIRHRLYLSLIVIDLGIALSYNRTLSSGLCYYSAENSTGGNPDEHQYLACGRTFFPCSHEVGHFVGPRGGNEIYSCGDCP